jgi:hypothetical protein
VGGGRDGGALGCNGLGFPGRRQSLEGLPDALHRRVAVGEPLHRLQMVPGRHAGKTVPGCDQARSRPIGRQLRELLLIGKGLHASYDSRFG